MKCDCSAMRIRNNSVKWWIASKKTTDAFSYITNNWHHKWTADSLNALHIQQSDDIKGKRSKHRQYHPAFFIKLQIGKRQRMNNQTTYENIYVLSIFRQQRLSVSSKICGCWPYKNSCTSNENNCCVSLRVYTLSLSQVAYDYYSVVKKSALSNEAKYKVLHNSSKVFTTDTSSEVRHSVPGESWEITGEGDARLPSGSL